jgi:hypothetical protein
VAPHSLRSQTHYWEICQICNRIYSHRPWVELRHQAKVQGPHRISTFMQTRSLYNLATKIRNSDSRQVWKAKNSLKQVMCTSLSRGHLNYKYHQMEWSQWPISMQLHTCRININWIQEGHLVFILIGRVISVRPLSLDQVSWLDWLWIALQVETLNTCSISSLVPLTIQIPEWHQES